MTEDFRSTFARRATQLLEHPEDEPWVTGIIWDEDLGVAVGAAGFHGSPDADGMVEVGYSVDPAYRRRGYARAAMQELLDRAIADPSVRVLRASISPDNEPSLNLVASFGLERNGEQWDEEDGLEWIFEIPTAARPDCRPRSTSLRSEPVGGFVTVADAPPQPAGAISAGR